MTALVTDMGSFVAVSFVAAEYLAITERELQRMELRLRCHYLGRRAAIAQIRFEHGLLSAEEQDAIILEGKALLTEIELWEAYQ